MDDGRWTMGVSRALSLTHRPSSAAHHPLPPLDIDILDGAASLVDKSLLRQERGEGEESRIVMLETIREYAVELLEQTDAEEAEELRRRHASFYLGLAERA